MPRARVDSCKHLLHAYKYMPISLKINEINTIYVENVKKNIIICIEKCRIGENFFAWTEVFCGYSAIAARSKHFAKKSI